MPTLDSSVDVIGAGDAVGAAPLLAAITVTYQPDIEILGRQLAQLPPACLKVWVDNASDPVAIEQMRGIAAGRSDLLLIVRESNAGLAAAMNEGARRASEWNLAVTHLLLLDQDSEPGVGGAEALFDAYQRLCRIHQNLGCIGPRLIDAQTGLEHGFHQISACRWVRRFNVPDFAIPVANLNGSGTLVACRLFHALGGLDADFFIDHVDTEWAFRVLAAGYGLYGVPGVEFLHRMGERSLRFWFLGWRVWPYRSARRHRFLFRNSVWLLRTSGVPICWKLWAPVKLAVTMLVHLVVDEARFTQVRNMFGGVWDGLSSHKLQR